MDTLEVVDLYSYDTLMWDDMEDTIHNSNNNNNNASGNGSNVLLHLEDDSQHSYNSNSNDSTDTTVSASSQDTCTSNFAAFIKDTIAVPQIETTEESTKDVKKKKTNNKTEKQQSNQKKRKRNSLSKVDSTPTLSLVTRSKSRKASSSSSSSSVSHVAVSEPPPQEEEEEEDCKSSSVSRSDVKPPLQTPSLLAASKTHQYKQQLEQEDMDNDSFYKLLNYGSCKKQKLSDQILANVLTAEKEIDRLNADFYRKEEEIEALQKQRQHVIHRVEQDTMINNETALFNTARRYYQRLFDQATSTSKLVDQIGIIKSEFLSVYQNMEALQKMAWTANSQGMDQIILDNCNYQNVIIEHLYKVFISGVQKTIRHMLQLRVQCCWINIPNMLIIQHLFRQLMKQHKISVIQSGNDELDDEYLQVEKYNTGIFAYLILTNEFLADPNLIKAILEYKVKTLYINKE